MVTIEADKELRGMLLKHIYHSEIFDDIHDAFTPCEDSSIKDIPNELYSQYLSEIEKYNSSPLKVNCGVLAANENSYLMFTMYRTIDNDYYDFNVITNFARFTMSRVSCCEILTALLGEKYED